MNEKFVDINDHTGSKETFKHAVSLTTKDQGVSYRELSNFLIEKMGGSHPRKEELINIMYGPLELNDKPTSILINDSDHELTNEDIETILGEVTRIFKENGAVRFFDHTFSGTSDGSFIRSKFNLLDKLKHCYGYDSIIPRVLQGTIPENYNIVDAYDFDDALESLSNQCKNDDYNNEDLIKVIFDKDEKNPVIFIRGFLSV
ncbi:MAG: hypothetical protein WCS86_02680 [Candidatus Paceibacterota bacterium]